VKELVVNGRHQVVTAWMDRAACAGIPIPDPEADPFFYPEGADRATRNVHNSAARAWCDRCPVADQCAAYATTNDIREGFWGGLSEEDRLEAKGWVWRDGRLVPPRRRTPKVPAPVDAPEPVEVTV
jgi:hypothetical protein